jgi:hypothetical protein
MDKPKPIRRIVEMPVEQTMKTSLRLPTDLWTAARIEALKRTCDAQDIVAEALERYLRKGGAK